MQLFTHYWQSLLYAANFKNSLDPAQALQKIGPDLDPNCLISKIMVYIYQTDF